jgi:hypothetical protein
MAGYMFSREPKTVPLVETKFQLLEQKKLLLD